MMYLRYWLVRDSPPSPEGVQAERVWVTGMDTYNLNEAVDTWLVRDSPPSPE